jgi:DNA-binding CsgD family transcriptional regulator
VEDRRPPRIAVVTMGQAPRPDVLGELRTILGDLSYTEFGVLDEVSQEQIARMVPRPGEPRFFTRLRDGSHVILEADAIATRIGALVERIDGQDFDLLILAMTGIRNRLATRTPLIHGQFAVEAWVAALTTGNSRIGTIFPLAGQGTLLSELGYGTVLQSSHATIGGSHATHLDDAIGRVAGADLIIMNSVGYTEEMAEQVARESGKPVVTACRIVASAARLRLAEIARRPLAAEAEAKTYTGTELLKRLLPAAEPLTQRESEVLVHALEGAANKYIGRSLGISHRTVEIHRSRAMVKLGATSVTELIWRALADQER